jgi:DNA-directed RNA polymerase subunit RPC12/RpoP
MTPEQYIEKFKEHTDEFVINDNCLSDVACPKCGYRDRFDIVCVASFDFTDDGTSDFEGIEYDRTAYTSCHSCGHGGPHSEFAIEGLDAALNKYIEDNYSHE